MKRILLALVVVLALAASGCSLELLGAPTGHLTLTATFDEVEDLGPGHTVQVANVVVGSVTKVALDGYRAKVTMSINDGHDIPEGTSAVLRRTSLLGEPFVALIFPAGIDVSTARSLGNGAAITETSTEPQIEDLADRAGRVLTAVSADDVAATVQAGAQAIGGKGPELNRLVAQLSQLVSALGAQQGDLGATIDNLGSLGASVAPLDDRIGSLLDSLSTTTTAVGADRDKLVTTLRAFDELATATNEVILLPHSQQLSDLLQQAAVILGSLAENQGVLVSMADSFAAFVPRITRAVSKSELLLFVWIDSSLSIGGSPVSSAIPPYLSQLVGP